MFIVRSCVSTAKVAKSRWVFRSVKSHQHWNVYVTCENILARETRSIHLLKNESVTQVSAGEIRKAVMSHFKELQNGHTGLVVDCPSCKETSHKQGKLNINLTTGYSFCTSCFVQGPWPHMEAYLNSLQEYKSISDNQSQPPSLAQFLSLEPVKQVDEMNQVWNSATPVKEVSEEALSFVLQKIGLQVLEAKTLLKVEAKINLCKNHLIIPCKTSCSVDYHSLRVFVPKTIENDAKTGDTGFEFHEIVMPSQHPWLLGYHLTEGKDEVVLTSTAADALIALQNLSVPALCLPNGISRLPLATLALLDRFRKITLWLDHGVRGQESAQMFAKKLGEGRCHYIRSSRDTPSPFQCRLVEEKRVAEVFRTAVPIAHKSVTTFSKLRKDVYDEIINSKQIMGVKWVRFPILTDLLKGHRRGELTIFTGPTGSGKTTFLSEYSLDLCNQSVRTLWGSFEICNVRLVKRMLQQFSGVNLEKEPNKFEAIADEFEELPMYFMAFYGQQNVDDVLSAMTHAVYVHDISHILIDNLQFMMGTDGNVLDRFYLQDKIVGSFRQFATINNVHITLVIHPRKEADELSTGSIFGGAKAAQEADNILILQDQRTGVSTVGRKFIQVAKNRYTGDLGKMPLEFHRESLSFAPIKTASVVVKKVPPLSTSRK